MKEEESSSDGSPLEARPRIADFAVPATSAVWARLVYVALFLLALIAIFTAWSQVGGQGHLDLMPWYYKLTLTFALAWALVAGTASAVSQKRAWNGRTILFMAAALLIALSMGLLTYYYHLHEEDEDDGNGNDIAHAVHVLAEG